MQFSKSHWGQASFDLGIEKPVYTLLIAAYFIQEKSKVFGVLPNVACSINATKKTKCKQLYLLYNDTN